MYWAHGSKTKFQPCIQYKRTFDVLTEDHDSHKIVVDYAKATSRSAGKKNAAVRAFINVITPDSDAEGQKEEWNAMTPAISHHKRIKIRININMNNSRNQWTWMNREKRKKKQPNSERRQISIRIRIRIHTNMNDSRKRWAWMNRKYGRRDREATENKENSTRATGHCIKATGRKRATGRNKNNRARSQTKTKTGLEATVKRREADKIPDEPAWLLRKHQTSQDGR
eukprot:jgi/Psemu1/68077/estExt_Genemark1.C_4280031